MNYTIESISSIIQAENKPLHDNRIRYILTDSRTVYYPDESVFFALETATNDGHKYIEELVKQGVRNFVVHQKNPAWETLGVNLLYVSNTLKALQDLATFHRFAYNIPIVGITGSNGKTIVKEWLNQLLQMDYRITRSPRSYNSQIGVPLSVCLLEEKTDIGIFEAGISQANEMTHLAGIIQPTIGIFTNLGDAHQEGFASMEEKLREKLSLFATSQVLICKYDTQIEAVVRAENPSIQLFSWSFDQTAPSTLLILSIEKSGASTTIHYQYKDESHSYHIPFVDDASIENSIQCLAFCLLLTIPTATIAERMQYLEPIAMRLEKKQGINNCLVINDTYNSDNNSLHIALDLLAYSAENNYTKRTVILSDISQSGEDDTTLYTKVAYALQQKNINCLIGIGTKIAQFASIFEGEKYFFPSTTEFLDSSFLYTFKNEAILVKGARTFQFERIVSKLELKMHETVLEINLNALVRNYNFFRSKLEPSTKTMCMIKANAYGCGAIEVAKTLQYHRCDYFGVAVADEGVELRKAGIQTPIIIMNPEPSSFGLLFDYNLEPEIYSFRLLKDFAAQADKHGMVKYPIHIKIDTGMHRLGFDPSEMEELARFIEQQNAVHIHSLFTHLVGADEERFDNFTKQQLALFETSSTAIQKHFTHPIMRHVLNSSGTERFSDYQYDMVRLGIGLYGISATNTAFIEPLVTLKTIILQIKQIHPEETIGYSRNGKVHRESLIATIPIGYADGLKRNLGNGNGYVLINGQKAPFIGNICMDISMIDITDIPNVQEGESVIVIGGDIHINELAQKSGTIPYEILTGISQRVKRIYYQE
ncbi:MAG: bifunctional UDP-N-acetylmuramoyl-tripeptide:D-alanyl-D-alanine ligase/alanine racemase [Paludibacteraceae bacterium]|nr:bifunctional UDP-N-acetylmuramoyl-tripeptide:D-alanyl-D-alanine ligase/alanine racemase [Paludibacteraceae bacterium]